MNRYFILTSKKYALSSIFRVHSQKLNTHPSCVKSVTTFKIHTLCKFTPGFSGLQNSHGGLWSITNAKYCGKKNLTTSSSSWISRKSTWHQNDDGKRIIEMREKNVLTIPNLLSFARIVACPFLGYLVLCDKYSAALLLFVIAGITDLLDGVIARRYPSQMSYLGSILDPIADKLLVGALTITLTMVHIIPVPLLVVILGRDIALIVSSFVVRFISLPQPRTLSRFFDPQLTTVQVTPSLIGKVNTSLQLGLISLSLAAPLLDITGHPGLVAIQYLVGMTTLISGVDYMRGQGFKYKTRPNS